MPEISPKLAGTKAKLPNTPVMMPQPISAVAMNFSTPIQSGMAGSLGVAQQRVQEHRAGDEREHADGAEQLHRRSGHLGAHRPQRPFRRDQLGEPAQRRRGAEEDEREADPGVVHRSALACAANRQNQYIIAAHCTVHSAPAMRSRIALLERKQRQRRPSGEREQDDERHDADAGEPFAEQHHQPGHQHHDRQSGEHGRRHGAGATGRSRTSEMPAPSRIEQARNRRTLFSSTSLGMISPRRDRNSGRARAAAATPRYSPVDRCSRGPRRSAPRAGSAASRTSSRNNRRARL